MFDAESKQLFITIENSKTLLLGAEHIGITINTVYYNARKNAGKVSEVVKKELITLNPTKVITFTEKNWVSKVVSKVKEESDDENQLIAVKGANRSRSKREIRRD